MHPERRVFWMTMFSRTTPEASPKLGFTPLELKLLDAAVSDKILRRWSFADYLNKLACLGGYLSRSHDPPPGNQVVGAASDGSRNHMRRANVERGTLRRGHPLAKNGILAKRWL
jgi:hypothetical protein